MFKLSTSISYALFLLIKNHTMHFKSYPKGDSTFKTIYNTLNIVNLCAGDKHCPYLN